MQKFTPEQKQKLTESTTPEEPTDETPDPLILILQTAKAKQQAQLDDLQTRIDALSEDFATRAASIVETGLRNSYQLARLKISAIGSVAHVLSVNLTRLRKRIALSGYGFKLIFKRKSESILYLALTAAFCCSI